VFFRHALATVLLILACAPLAAARDIALVANKSNRATAITLAELVKICKGQTNRWPDGKVVTFVTRDPSSPDMKIILEKVYGMSSDEVAAQIAAANHGRVSHPAIIVVESDDALVRRVESTPGAVGLVDVYSINGGISVVKISGKLPLEPGYPLHGN